MRFFEDIAVGETRTIGAHVFSADEIKRFASAFDPQPFHLDEDAAAKSHFGALCASGWHTMAVWMRLNVRAIQEEIRTLQRAGEPVARLGPSPGFDTLKWLKPVYVGDTITFESVVAGKKASRSKPEWGLVTFQNIGRNQAGVEVVSFVGHVFVERREKSLPEAE